MIRRNFLKTATAFILPQPGGSSIKYFGWLPPFLPNNEPNFYNIYPEYKGIGKGKVVLLYKYLEAILKQPLLAHKQTGSDCTSQAGGLGVDILQAIQVLLKKDKWENKIATEVLHIGGRQLIGKRKSGGVRIDELNTFLKKYGTVYRRKYQTYNFTTYDYANCTKLTKTGIPEWLLKECKKHQIIKSLKISTWNEAIDAIRSLHPIVIGSKLGFESKTRDKDGFTEPNGIWYHAWLLIAIDDRYKRPGGCLMSSWGDNFFKGSRRYNQPKGSIWVDKSVLEEMIEKFGDSYALCQFKGSKPVKYNLW